jgi:hypothetical protein
VRKKGEEGMSKSRHTEAQMIGALKQVEAGRKVEDVAREVGVSKRDKWALWWRGCTRGPTYLMFATPDGSNKHFTTLDLS